MIEKWVIIVVLIACSFLSGTIYGCSKASDKYVEAETKFITKKEYIVKIEKELIPVIKEKIRVVTEVETKYIREAHEDKSIPNPISCELTPSRVYRINQISTSYRP